MINLIMSILAYIVLFLAIAFVPRMRQEKALFLIVGLTILFNAIGMEWLYKALEQYTYITVRSIIFKLIAVVAMFVLVHEQKDYVIYGGISILAASASNVFNFFHAHKYVSIKPVGSYNFRQHLKPIVIFFAMSCAATIYTNLDTVMLGFMTSDAEVGYYNAAVKIKSILVSVVTSLGVVLLPRASYYVECKLMDKFCRITHVALNFVILISVPLTVYFILFAKEGIFFLSGAEYEASIVPMQIIMPTLLFIGLTNIMGIQTLIPLGKEKVVLYSEIAGAVADLLLNVALIPSMASAGAAIGTVVAEGVVFAVQFWALRKEVLSSYQKVRYGTIVLALALAIASCLWVKTTALGSFASLLVSAILFFAVYGGVLVLRKEPLAWQMAEKVRQMLFKKRKIG